MLRVSASIDPILARPFGISAVIRRQAIELYYRVVGKGTALLSTVERGAMLSLQGPLGNGFPEPDRDALPILVAGGSGFPPLLFFAARLASKPVVFLGARNKDCLVPATAIKCCRSHARKVYITTDDGSAGKAGFVTDALTAFLDGSRERDRAVIYSCGPRAMMAAVSKVAADRNVPSYVSMEERMACGLGVCMGCSVAVKAGGYKRVCKEGPVFDARVIDWSEHVVLPVPNGKQVK